MSKHDKVTNASEISSSSGQNQLEAELLAALGASTGELQYDPNKYHHTDAGNAEFFVDLFGEDLRYVEEWDCWMKWNGQLWIGATDISLLSLARRTTKLMFLCASTLEPIYRDPLLKHAKASERIERLRAMINLSKGDPALRASPKLFDADPWLLGCGGVTVNLQSGRFHQARRCDYITKKTTVTPDMDADCPNWKEFLNWAFDGDQDTIDHIQRICGYMMTGDVSEEKLFAFHGSGSNGKTTIAMTIFDMLGDYSGKARSDLLVSSQGENGNASPDIAALHGKRLVLVSETDECSSLAEAQVKAITSNEPITARRPNCDLFTFNPTHKTLLLTNHPPVVKGMDDGIWRRLNIISFNATMSEQERNRHFRDERLLPELPAILAWSLKGCAMWVQDELRPSAAVLHATATYRSQMDYFGEWLEEHTTKDPDARTTRREAYQNYAQWANANGAPVLKKNKFNEEMKSRGYKITIVRGIRIYNGLKIVWRSEIPQQVDAA